MLKDIVRTETKQSLRETGGAGDTFIFPSMDANSFLERKAEIVEVVKNRGQRHGE
jgi:hypothetical protein